jgi:hypothetical protein
MKKLTTIDSSSKQSLYYVTDEGEQIKLNLRYMPRNEIWYLDLESETFNVNGVALLCSLNVLDKYRNLVDYGIMIGTIDGNDPWQVTDFETGYASLYMLNKQELKEISGILDGENQG